MLLTVKAKTSVKDLIIDYIQITTETGQSIALNWEQSHVTRTDTGFEAEYLGVCFDEKPADEKLMDLAGMTVDVIGLYSEQQGKLDIEVTEMYFYEDDKDLTFESPYRAEDNDAYMEFKSNLENFIKAQVKEDYEKELNAFSEDEDEGGLYDIAYDMKPIIEVNEFNPFTDEEKTTEDYDLAFDDWYDYFIETTIFPILKRMAYERKEGKK